MSRTTISVYEETRDALYYKKRPGESYDEFLRRVCGVERTGDTAEQKPRNAER